MVVSEIHSRRTHYLKESTSNAQELFLEHPTLEGLLSRTVAIFPNKKPIEGRREIYWYVLLLSLGIIGKDQIKDTGEY